MNVTHSVHRIWSRLRHELMMILMSIRRLTVTCLMVLILILVLFSDVVCIVELLFEDVWVSENVELCAWVILLLEHYIRANLRDFGS